MTKDREVCLSIANHAGDPLTLNCAEAIDLASELIGAATAASPPARGTGPANKGRSL
ncbi:hypothetical protein KZ820_07035 [Sphingomonas sp. RRHST34]|uniref:Uncharacterized protein n=1 Tax=Sphingomonas citri TaxID=2862499 RepID=A0ABS7BLL3_9SPHN|nr:hypothetical protein [Sphingomonas citri]MBW6530486.1 hypothetical protein [Sphingomonas citri]